MPDTPVEPPAPEDYPDDMATRVAVLETLAQQTNATLVGIREELRALRNENLETRREARTENLEARREARTDLMEFRRDMGAQLLEIRRIHDRDFRLMFAALIAATLGLAALIAHTQHWL